MAAETILIVEDDPAMLRGLKDNFEYEGFRVTTASDGEKGLSLALDAPPDLIILDIMLPKVNGYEICRLLRERRVATPIIMLTAKGEEPDIVLGLNLGADDYVTKPFAIRELVARTRARLRRTRPPDAEAIVFGGCVLDTAARTLTRGGGGRVDLTPKEYGLLEHLLRNAPRAITRSELLDAVWGRSVFVTSRSVDRCVNTLRGKIEPDPANPSHILTVRDVGYRFDITALD